MKKRISSFAFCIAIVTIQGQKIEIGQDAGEVAGLVQWIARDNNKYDVYGNTSHSRASYDVVYNDGEITDAILCYQHQYIIDYNVIANFCKHYMMENGKLAYILTQYENLSTSKLTEFYNNNYGKEHRQGQFYFSEDYQHYSEIFLAKNGLATVGYHKTESSALPPSIRKAMKEHIATAEKWEQMKSRLKAEQEEREAKALNERREKEATERRLREQKEDAIRSKVYRLVEYPSAYNHFLDDYKTSLSNCLKGSMSDISFDNLKNSREKYIRVQNKYKDYFKAVYNASANKFKVERQTSLLDGTDKSHKYIDCAIKSMPLTTVEGIGVGAEVEFEPTLDLVKGVSEITVSKSGVIKFKNKPPTEIQEKILNKLREANTPKGKFVLNYTYSKIMDNEDAQIQLLYKKTNKEVTEETERKRKRKTKAVVGGVVGGVGLVGVLVGLIFW